MGLEQAAPGVAPKSGRAAGSPGFFSSGARKLQLGLLVVLIAVLAAAFVGGRGQPAAPGAQRAATVGAPAPAFTTTELDGTRVSLAGFRGRPVLLNFWATWCTACQDEMPALQRAYDRHRNQGLQVLAIDYRESDVPALRSYLQALHVSFPAALDRDGRIATAYGVSIGLPVSVFVAPDGRVAYIHVGAMQPSIIELGVAKAIAS